METHLLLVILSSAATALVVAAGLGSWTRRSGVGGGGKRGGAWLIGAIAMLAALIPATRITLGDWPPFPAVQSLQWTLYIAAAAVIGIALTAWMSSRAWPARSLLAAAGAGSLVVFFQLAGALSRMDSPGVRIAWMAGIAAVMLLQALIVGAAFTRADAAPPDGASALARLRDRHWPTLALGLIFGVSAPAILFASHTMKLLEQTVAIACGLGGLALVAWLIHRRLNLAGAAVVAVLVHSALWLVAYFYGDEAHAPALALAAAAPCSLVIGTWGPLARRGGWLRLAVVSVIGLGLIGSVAALYGPAYLAEIREMQAS
jgi:hypothetical protein